MNKLFYLLGFGLTFTLHALGQQKESFCNPVIRGDMADPSIIRIGKTYYATGTSSEWAPFYPVFTSKDLVNWKQTGHIFDQKPEWTSNSFWAPELYHHKNGKTYCYYTARRKSDNVSYIGVATADSPTGKYTDHGLLVEYGTEAIDAFIYDDNGQLYITWKAYGLDGHIRPIEIVGSKLSDDGMRLEGEVFSLLADTERIGIEGQYHFKQGDYYYMLYSALNCCGPQSDYDVRVARAKSFEGPYEKYEGNPILYGDGSDFQSVGHGTGVTTPDGRMYYMCHGYLKNSNRWSKEKAGFYMGRQPILHEMYVGDDNWVHFSTGNIARKEQPVPFKGTKQKWTQVFKDNFKGKKLKVEWTWNYPFAEVTTQLHNGRLTLGGIPVNNSYPGNVLCLRPTETDYTYKTGVTNQNSSLKGLTMYGDDKNYMAWGYQDNNIRLVIIKDGNEQIVYDKTVPDGATPHFKIEVLDGCHLYLFFKTNDKGWDLARVNGDEPLDLSYLTRWDRVARPGLIHAGSAGESAEFSYFNLYNGIIVRSGPLIKSK